MNLQKMNCRNRKCLLLVLAIRALSLVVRATDCNPGFSSPGWMYPENDIYIMEGDSYQILCGVNQSHPFGANRTARDLKFDIRMNDTSSVLVENLNETTIRLFVKRSEISPNGHYSVLCKMGDMGICTRNVYVGYPPQGVTNFKCISYNWENLTCTWDTPPNPIQTFYNISYKMAPTSGQMSFACPVHPSKNSCTWTTRTNPIYMRSFRHLNFTITYKNALVDTAFKQAMGVLENFAVVVPNKMEKLAPKEVTSHSITVEWNVPLILTSFPAGLVYRVTYRVISSWADPIPQEVDTSSVVSNGGKVTLKIMLPYANTLYDISVRARSASANASVDSMWSQPTSIVVNTSADSPCRAPETPKNAFEIGNGLDTRSVTVYWSQLPPECENGNDFAYKVELYDMQNNDLNTTVISRSTSAQFHNLARNKPFMFRIKSKNSLGYSKDSSEIFLPAAAAMPSLPESVTKVAYNDTLFEVAWTPASPSTSNSLIHFDKRFHFATNITGYTVYWCRSIRDNPVQCEGDLYWESVPSTQRSINVTVSDPKANYQFAVGTDQGNYSSGMAWSGCFIIANRGVGQVRVVNIIDAKEDSISIAWDLSCFYRSGIVTGFKIYYCPFENNRYVDEESQCTGPSKEKTIEGDLDHYTLKGLKPNTNYMIMISALSRSYEGPKSEAFFQQTLESAPSAPVGLRAFDVTNSTVKISWHRPEETNGVLTNYTVYYKGIEITLPSTHRQFTMEKLDSFSVYDITVTACNRAGCSPKSNPLQVKTLIGVPSPLLHPPGITVNSQNHSIINVSWIPPYKPAGVIDHYLVQIRIPVDTQDTALNVREQPFETRNLQYNISGTKTSLQISDELCIPNEVITVVVQAVNRAENGELLFSPWSEEGSYTCPSAGPTVGKIVAIAVVVGGCILLTIFAFFVVRWAKKKCDYAKGRPVILPWDNISSTFAVDKNIGIKTNDNIYTVYKKRERLESKLSNDGSVITTATASSSVSKKGMSCTSERQSRSSGCSSAHGSISSHSTSHSQLSSTNDSGAELEPPKSSAADTIFWKSAINDDETRAPSLENIANSPVSKGNGQPINYSKINFGNGSHLSSGSFSTPNVNQIGHPYVKIGSLPTDLPAKCSGYVTLGVVESPNASPNLSIGSNDSLISKKERYVSLSKISSSSKGTVGNVEVKPAVADSRCDEIELCQPTSQGYVAFKCGETNNSEGICNPNKTGYVTLGAVTDNRPTVTTTATVNPITNAHYVTLGMNPELVGHKISYI